jgi:hypothetical protein
MPKRAVNPLREVKTWGDLGQAAYKKQLAAKPKTYWDDWAYGPSPKRKTAPKDGLSRIDNPSARRSRLTER